MSGFDRTEVSLLAGEDTVVEIYWHKYKKVEEIEDEANAARADYVDAESVGEAKGALMGSLLYIGAFVAIIDEHHAKYLQHQLDHGGLLLWVRTRDSGLEKAAKEMLARLSGRDVHAHALKT